MKKNAAQLTDKEKQRIFDVYMFSGKTQKQVIEAYSKTGIGKYALEKIIREKREDFSVRKYQDLSLEERQNLIHDFNSGIEEDQLVGKYNMSRRQITFGLGLNQGKLEREIQIKTFTKPQRKTQTQEQPKGGHVYRAMQRAKQEETQQKREEPEALEQELTPEIIEEEIKPREIHLPEKLEIRKRQTETMQEPRVSYVKFLYRAYKMRVDDFFEDINDYTVKYAKKISSWFKGNLLGVQTASLVNPQSLVKTIKSKRKKSRTWADIEAQKILHQRINTFTRAIDNVREDLEKYQSIIGTRIKENQTVKVDLLRPLSFSDNYSFGRKSNQFVRNLAKQEIPDILQALDRLEAKAKESKAIATLILNKAPGFDLTKYALMYDFRELKGKQVSLETLAEAASDKDFTISIEDLRDKQKRKKLALLREYKEKNLPQHIYQAIERELRAA